VFSLCDGMFTMLFFGGAKIAEERAAYYTNQNPE
jgi:hypothetical protein